MIRSCLILALLAVTPVAARDRLPDDAPYCARPGTQPIFLSPMGEPFRAAIGQAYPSAMWFAAADRNHDGKVDRGEFITDADRFFKIIDTNHDGHLTPEEIGHYESAIAPETSVYSVRGREFAPPGGNRSLLSSIAPRSGESDYYGPLGAGSFAWLNIPEPVVAADSDVDRIITEKEFLSAAGRRFEQLDPEGKGELILAALPKTPAQAALEGPCRKRPKPKTPEGKAREKDLRDDEREDRMPR